MSLFLFRLLTCSTTREKWPTWIDDDDDGGDDYDDDDDDNANGDDDDMNGDNEVTHRLKTELRL